MEKYRIIDIVTMKEVLLTNDYRVVCRYLNTHNTIMLLAQGYDGKTWRNLSSF